MLPFRVPVSLDLHLGTDAFLPCLCELTQVTSPAWSPLSSSMQWHNTQVARSLSQTLAGLSNQCVPSCSSFIALGKPSIELLSACLLPLLWGKSLTISPQICPPFPQMSSYTELPLQSCLSQNAILPQLFSTYWDLLSPLKCIGSQVFHCAKINRILHSWTKLHLLLTSLA